VVFGKNWVESGSRTDEEILPKKEVFGFVNHPPVGWIR
jgi:hypothetical protein